MVAQVSISTVYLRILVAVSTVAILGIAGNPLRHMIETIHRHEALSSGFLLS